MQMIGRRVAWTFLLAGVACGGDSGRGDAGAASGDGDVAHDGAPGDAARWDAGVGDAGEPRPDGEVCSVTPGDATFDAFCGFVQLALMDDGAGSVRARLSGTLSLRGLPTPAGSCVQVDSVEVLEVGDPDVVLATLDGAGAYRSGEQEVLASGPSAPALDGYCRRETERFDSVGLRIRGRAEGGTFEARCGAFDPGSWPPTLVLTCHRNVDDHPTEALATVESLAGTEYTQVYFNVPHDGAPLSAVDSSVHVIGQAAETYGAAPAPPPFDATFAVDLHETSSGALGSYTEVRLRASPDPLGELCTRGDPGPEGVPPPVLIFRVTGSSTRGPFSTEAYASQCFRL